MNVSGYDTVCELQLLSKTKVAISSCPSIMTPTPSFCVFLMFQTALIGLSNIMTPRTLPIVGATYVTKGPDIVIGANKMNWV